MACNLSFVEAVYQSSLRFNASAQYFVWIDRQANGHRQNTCIPVVYNQARMAEQKGWEPLMLNMYSS